MKKEIIEVQNYFKNKLIAGNFHIISVEEHSCKVRIDDEFDFTIWTSNIAKCRKLYNEFGGYNFIDFYIEAAESEILERNLRPILNEYFETVTKIKKLEEFEQLKKELNLI